MRTNESKSAGAVRSLEINPDNIEEVAPQDISGLTASVILPLHNAEAHVAGAVSQLRSLTGVQYELIVVDDGSSDGTWELLLNEEFHAPTTLIRFTRNAGVARARNTALRAASGKYVWMVDGDDGWGRESLATLVLAAEESQKGLIVASAEKLVVSTGERMNVAVPRRTGAYNTEDMVAEVLTGGLRGHLWNKLFRADRLRTDPFPVMRSKSDYCMIIGSLTDLKDMWVIGASVYEYRYQQNSITNSSKATPLDLLRCYEELMRVLSSVDGIDPARWRLSHFRYFSIAQIVMSELWRFERAAVSGTVASEYVRGMLTWKDLIALIGHATFSELVRAVGLKALPGLMGKMYRSRRARRWA